MHICELSFAVAWLNLSPKQHISRIYVTKGKQVYESYFVNVSHPDDAINLIPYLNVAQMVNYRFNLSTTIILSKISLCHWHARKCLNTSSQNHPPHFHCLNWDQNLAIVNQNNFEAFTLLYCPNEAPQPTLNLPTLYLLLIFFFWAPHTLPCHSNVYIHASNAFILSEHAPSVCRM